MGETAQAVNWAMRATALLFATAVALVAIGIPVAGSHLVWRAAVLAGGVTAAVLCVHRNRIHPVFAAMIALAATRLVLVDVDDLTFTVRNATWPQAVGDLIAGPLLAVGLAATLRARRGRFSWREIVDAGSVVLGAGLVGWIGVTNPAWEAGVSFPLAVAGGVFVVVAFLLVHFVIELATENLLRNRAMRYLIAGTLVNLAATCVRSGIDPSVAGGIEIRATVALFSIAFLLGCASMSHPDAPELMQRNTARPFDPRREVLRLVPFGLSLLAVGFLGATVQTTSGTDMAVRAVLRVGIIIAVIARLYMALVASFRAQQRLERRLDTDDLTGLPNRRRLVSMIDHWIADSQAPTSPTVVQVNVDRFKNLNDAFGHDAANDLLVMISKRLAIVATRLDGVLARSGGDEFVIVHRTASCPQEALDRALAVTRALEQPFNVDGASIFVTASIGVAMARNSGAVSADELVRRANIATHRAKSDGRNRAVLFDESMHSRLAHRMDVEHALHEALARNEMLLYHQPIVDITNGRLTGFEALIRWRRSDGTMVSPGDFISIAEETGIIVDLGAWALHTALGHLRQWIDDGIVPPNASMSVNVSPRQVADADFVDVVTSALSTTGIAPHQLWLEVTESMMLDEPETAEVTLRAIRAMGVRLALDDFGTGYSSLSLLQRFPVQRIKIDRAFVQGIAEQGNDRSLVRTIIAMAQSMGLDLVAEGVETVEQLRALRELGCDRAQGYLISRPVPEPSIPTTVSALAEIAELLPFANGRHLDTASSTSAEEIATPASRPLGAMAMMPLA